MLKLQDPCRVRLARPARKSCTLHIHSELIFTEVPYAYQDEIHCV